MKPEAEADEDRSRRYPVEEDMRFQRLNWRLERGGRVALLLFVALAMLGVFSQGPLSSATFESKGGSLKVGLDRFQRSGASARMTVDLFANPNSVIEIEESLFHSFDLESIYPEPRSMTSAAGTMRIELHQAPTQPATIHLNLRANRVGPVAFNVTHGTTSVRVRVFVYP